MPNFHFFTALAAALCLFPQPACSGSGELVPTDSRLQGLRTEIEAAVSKGRLASVSIGIIDDGRVIWRESFGFADRAKGIKASPKTRYGLASLGKSVTATGVMTLVGKGKIGLDDPVSKSLGAGALRNYACSREPTIRQLLDMTSGVPHGAASYRIEAPLAERELMKPRSIVVFCPGEIFHYSNYSVAVADAVIETASDEDFGHYLRLHVFEPLGMEHAALGTPAAMEVPATRYGEDGKPLPPFQTFPRSSRGMSASLDDLLKYAAFNMKAPLPGQLTILSDALLDTMHYDRSDAPGAITAIGWGSLTLDDGRRWLITNGNDMGVQSILAILPDTKTAVVMLSNNSGFQLDELAFRALDTLSPGLLRGFEKARAVYEHSRPVQSDAGWVGRWSGEIETADRPMQVRVSVAPDGKADIELAGQASTKLAAARLAHGLFTASFRGRLRTDEFTDAEHHIDLALQRRGEAATGFLNANFENERGKFELPIAIRLRRESP